MEERNVINRKYGKHEIWKNWKIRKVSQKINENKETRKNRRKDIEKEIKRRKKTEDETLKICKIRRLIRKEGRIKKRGEKRKDRKRIK